MADTDWDYVVVGAGAAGSVIAARLSEDPSIRVLLVEAGGRDTYFPFHIPGLGFLAASRRAQNWWFETERMPELAGRKQVWLQGKVLGGSSSINGMVFNRGHAREYDLWRQMGCEGWSFDDVLPFFKKVELNERGETYWHGGSGPMRVRKSAPILPIYEDFLQACEKDGLPVLPDLNENTVDGVGFFDINVGSGRRMSAATAYLRPARKRENLHVLSNTQARRIFFNGRRAAGIELRRRDEVWNARVRREIVLCGGAIKSPQLLMLSGIGPAGELADHGIEVLVNSPNVGGNLQNHPSYRMQYTCSGRTTAFNYLTPTGMIKSVFTYAIRRQGGLAESIFAAGGFFRSRPDLEVPDIQVLICGALMPRPTDRPTLWQMLPKRQGFAVWVYQGTPYSRGEVRLRSSDPEDAPKIFPGYFRDARDMDVLMAGVRRMRAICNGPNRPRDVVSEVAPGESIQTDADLEADIRQNIGTSFHQSGTCGMGSQPANVLDARLRVRGVQGVRVADASVMPVMPNAALHGPVLMIAEKAAAMILEDAKNDAGSSSDAIFKASR